VLTKIYVISGETSGDQHAAKVIGELKKMNPSCQIRGMGGDNSEAAGQELILHQKEMAIMGIWEVLINLRKISRNLSLIKNDIAEWKPEAILLVDYPGFNFKIAKYAHSLDIPVHYYISPKVWAWKERRVEFIKKYVNKLYSILPFEIEYFHKKQVEVTYVGNPSKEAVDTYLSNNAKPEKSKKIALLPGSRAQEISTSLPIMLEAVNGLDGYEVLIAQAPGFDAEFYHQFGKNLTLIKNDMYGLLSQCEAALVTSGTATLETALMGVPQVVCYKTSKLSYEIVKYLIKVKYISLVNLILDKPSITELIQDEFNAETVRNELESLLKPSDRLNELTADYIKLNELLGDLKPSEMVAEEIINYSK
jgi:lipid-A-disaccharide synthase